MDDTIQLLAKGPRGKKLIEMLEKVKAHVADIRTPLKIAPGIQNEVRLGIIEVLDMELIDKLKTAADDIAPPDNNEHI